MKNINLIKNRSGSYGRTPHIRHVEPPYIHYVPTNLLTALLIAYRFIAHMLLIINLHYYRLTAVSRVSEACKRLMTAVKSLGTIVDLEKVCSLFDLG